MPSTRTSFTCLAKMPVKVPLIVIRLAVMSGGVPLFGLCWKMHLLQPGWGKYVAGKSVPRHLAVALVRQLLCDRIKPEGPKERQESDAGKPQTAHA